MAGGSDVERSLVAVAQAPSRPFAPEQPRYLRASHLVINLQPPSRSPRHTLFEFVVGNAGTLSIARASRETSMKNGLRCPYP
jgi:hypothetical protein